MESKWKKAKIPASIETFITPSKKDKMFDSVYTEPYKDLDPIADRIHKINRRKRFLNDTKANKNTKGIANIGIQNDDIYHLDDIQDGHGDGDNHNHHNVDDDTNPMIENFTAKAGQPMSFKLLTNPKYIQAPIKKAIQAIEDITMFLLVTVPKKLKKVSKNYLYEKTKPVVTKIYNTTASNKKVVDQKKIDDDSLTISSFLFTPIFFCICVWSAFNWFFLLNGDSNQIPTPKTIPINLDFLKSKDGEATPTNVLLELLFGAIIFPTSLVDNALFRTDWKSFVSPSKTIFMGVLLTIISVVFYHFDVFTILEGMLGKGSYKLDAGIMFVVSILILGFAFFKTYDVGMMILKLSTKVGFSPQGLAIALGLALLYGVCQIGIAFFSVPLALVFLALYISVYSLFGIPLYGGGFNIFGIMTDIYNNIQKGDIQDIKENPDLFANKVTSLIIKNMYSLFFMVLILTNIITKLPNIHHQWLRYVTITISVLFLFFIGTFSINEYKEGYKIIENFILKKEGKPNTPTPTPTTPTTSDSPTPSASPVPDGSKPSGVFDSIQQKLADPEGMTNEINDRLKTLGDGVEGFKDVGEKINDVGSKVKGMLPGISKGLGGIGGIMGNVASILGK